MKQVLLILLGLLLSANGHAGELSAAEKATLEKMDGDYARDTKAASLDYAWLLYRAGDRQHRLRANTVLNQVFSLQDGDPESPTYGQWNWIVQDGERKADLNNALFRADIMFTKLWEQQEKMSHATRAAFLTSCKRIVEAAKRRWETEVFDIGRDFTAYSNIFVLYVETLTLAGDRFNDARLKKIAKSQWTRWYNHISFFGIDEFASPTYNAVIFTHLMNIHAFCHDERIERESKEVLDRIYLLQSAITHPVLKLPVSGISRDYRLFLVQDDARSTVLTAPPEGYVPPSKATEINEARSYPFEVVGKAAAMPFIFKSYQLQDAAMGSMTGGNCFQQQIHCMAAVGNSEKERAVLFLQGSNTPVNGFTDQQGMSALCVYNRLPTYWHLTQWRGDMSHYKETFDEFGVGLSPNWKEQLHTPGHIVIAAYGYEVHLFPFILANGALAACDMEMKHRTTTSARYHPRPRIFDEYVFPPEPEWFGAYITMVKSGTGVPDPGIASSAEEGSIVFTAKPGHRIRLFVTEQGETKQLFNADPATIPLLRIGG